MNVIQQLVIPNGLENGENVQVILDAVSLEDVRNHDVMVGRKRQAKS